MQVHRIDDTMDHIKSCVTGFNAGHSSFNFLSSRRDLVVHSFDVGGHRYVSPMMSFLRRKFPGRLKVQLGDSRLTVPRHLHAGRSLSCDLILVDGGHGFDVALSDVRNLARVASQPHNVIVVDDVNMRQVRTAWKLAQKSGDIQQIFTCRFGTKGRAFAVGIVGHPHNNTPCCKSRTGKDSTRLSCSLYVCLSIAAVFAVALIKIVWLQPV